MTRRNGRNGKKYNRLGGAGVPTPGVPKPKPGRRFSGPYDNIGPFPGVCWSVTDGKIYHKGTKNSIPGRLIHHSAALGNWFIVQMDGTRGVYKIPLCIPKGSSKSGSSRKVRSSSKVRKVRKGRKGRRLRRRSR